MRARNKLLKYPLNVTGDLIHTHTLSYISHIHITIHMTWYISSHVSYGTSYVMCISYICYMTWHRVYHVYIVHMMYMIYIFSRSDISLIAFRDRGSGTERKREILMLERQLHLLGSPASDGTCNLGLCPDRIKPTALQFMVQCSTHLSHTGQAVVCMFKWLSEPSISFMKI